jgi:hypothetical protein
VTSSSRSTPTSPGFLQHGICSCYRPVADDTPLGAATKLTAEDWNRLLHLAQTDRARALELFQSDWYRWLRSAIALDAVADRQPLEFLVVSC